ncbi:MAG: 1,4-alpha-glucan-branching enzyme, partial [Dysgonamonadaceae bacterium]|nr:1,4-alpha-glucan-branching enzyme [Dysgonamonadaceae bacterium]
MALLRLIKNDPWLDSFRPAIEGRYQYFLQKVDELTQGGTISLSDFASGHLYFGLHRTANGWVFREWAPYATAIFLTGDFNQWQETPDYQLHPLDNGVWEIHLPDEALHHEDLYKLKIHWNGGSGERIPAWAQRVVQDENTYIFNAQVWNPPQPYSFTVHHFKPDTSP